MNLMTLNLTAYPGEYAEADVLKALSGAVDLSSQPLFAENGVQRGVNAEILDAMFRTPNEAMCPLVMLQTWVENEVSAQGGGRIHTDYMMSLYFVYYFGVPSTQFVAIDYVQQRRRHLTAAMKAIEMQTGGNLTATIPVSRHWKWDTSKESTFTYDYSFENMGTTVPVPPGSGFNCVRVNRPISVWH